MPAYRTPPGRIYAARSLKITAHLRESCGPGMPGPYV